MLSKITLNEKMKEWRSEEAICFKLLYFNS